jgi:hypothetical protein
MGAVGEGGSGIWGLMHSLDRLGPQTVPQLALALSAASIYPGHRQRTGGGGVMRAFGSAGTPVATVEPTLRIVASGPFRFSRNPIYIALLLIHCGLALVLRSPVALQLALPALLVLHFGVMLREERYLSARFGDSYDAYRASVRRWL